MLCAVDYIFNLLCAFNCLQPMKKFVFSVASRATGRLQIKPSGSGDENVLCLMVVSLCFNVRSQHVEKLRSVLRLLNASVVWRLTKKINYKPFINLNFCDSYLCIFSTWYLDCFAASLFSWIRWVTNSSGQVRKSTHSETNRLQPVTLVR